MNKEDILARSRNEKRDEWSLFVENKAMSWGYYAAVIVILVFEAIHLILNNDEAFFSLVIVASFVKAFYHIGRAKYDQKKGSWIAGVLMLCLSLLMACVYILMVLE